MSNPKQLVTQLAAAIQVGNIQYEIKTPEEPNDVLEVSMTAIFENVAVVSGYDTELEAEMTFKYRNSPDYPDNNLPDCQSFYELNTTTTDLLVFTAIVFVHLGSVNDIFGDVGWNSPTLEASTTGASAIAIAINKFITVVTAF